MTARGTPRVCVVTPTVWESNNGETLPPVVKRLLRPVVVPRRCYVPKGGWGLGRLEVGDHVPPPQHGDEVLRSSLCVRGSLTGQPPRSDLP